MIYNWFKESQIIDCFYRFAMSPSAVEKHKGLREWGLKHYEMAKAVGLSENNPEFIYWFTFLSDVFRNLTDALGRLPTKDEFIETWDAWKPTMNLDAHGWADISSKIKS